jgi:hypothetical protein
MTLSQFQALKVWHTHHGGHPLEKGTWDIVLTLWMMGWVGGPAALLLDVGWAEWACLAALFLPGAYVSWRARMHRRGRLRCDWISALTR